MSASYSTEYSRTLNDFMSSTFLYSKLQDFGGLGKFPNKLFRDHIGPTLRIYMAPVGCLLCYLKGYIRTKIAPSSWIYFSIVAFASYKF